MVAWYARQPVDNLYLTITVVADLAVGIGLLPAGRRRRSFEAWLSERVLRRFDGRILPFDVEAVTFDTTKATRYVITVIKSFRDRRTAAAFGGLRLKGFPPDLVRRAQRRLRQLHAARTLQDLRLPPSNRLEALERERRGQQSIRINDQWRICFVWQDGDAYDVEIVDYH